MKIKDYLIYEQPSKYIVDSDIYSDEYNIPVLTAGQTFILGYTNEKDNIYYASKEKPVILFDDFTCSVQYVDFPFKVKSSALKILKPSKICDVKYFYYLLKNLKINNSTHKRYWISEVAEKDIKNISLEEQKEIRLKLDTIYNAIILKKKDIEDFLKLKKSLFYEMFKKGEFNDIELDKTADFIDYRGKTPNKTTDGILLITAKNVKNENYVSDPREFISEEEYKKRMTRGFPQENDVLFTTEAPLGNVCRIPKGIGKFCTGQRIITLHPKNGIIISEYLEYVLLSDEIQSEIWKNSTGSTVKGIKSKLLAKIKIPVPSLQEQKKFKNKINIIDKIIEIEKYDIIDLEKLLIVKVEEYIK